MTSTIRVEQPSRSLTPSVDVSDKIHQTERSDVNVPFGVSLVSENLSFHNATMRELTIKQNRAVRLEFFFFITGKVHS